MAKSLSINLVSSSQSTTSLVDAYTYNLPKLVLDVYGNSYHESDYVFTWEDGRLYSTDYVTKSFKKFIRRDENLSSDLKFHDLRKSCVSILIDEGCTVKEVQK